MIPYANNNLYTILGAQPCVEAREIRTKYRHAALRVHPDKGGTAEAFRLLTFAFEVLSCPFARAIYDKSYAHPSHQAVGAKRPAPAAKPPPQKRQRARQTNGLCSTDAAEIRQDRMANIGGPVQHLRIVLQCMQANERRAALQTLSPRVQAALMLIMKKTPAADTTTPSHKCSADAWPTKEEKLHTETEPTADLGYSTLLASAISGTTAGANANINTTSLTYKAHAHMKALRFYTRGHAEFEVALERQMVLVQFRQALSAVSKQDPCLWEDPAKVYDIFCRVLDENATSEEEMGLSAFVYLRAGHLLEQSCTIISPVMPLREVLQLHCQLLRARRTSWEELREAWVGLLQSKHQAISKRKTLGEAEAIADAARASALKIQFAKAAGTVSRALDAEELRAARRCKLLLQHEALKACRVVRAKRSEQATVQREAAKAQGDVWKERQRWSVIAGCEGEEIR